jgi:3-oxoacyl-[acyl-carrier protein] reductase
MNYRNVIVTGASRGIGRSIALLLASSGYNLVINCSKSKNELLKVQEEINAYPVKCGIHIGDLGNPDEAESLTEIAHKTFGGSFTGILINNAGISHVGLTQDMSFDEWNRLVNINLSSVFYMSKLIIPEMINNKSGRIINISSVWGLCGASCETAYSAAKGGINAFTRALGKELAPSNIQVNAIACGAVDTSMNSCFSDEDLENLCNEIPAGRMASPEEIAQFTLQLINAPSYLTGEVIKMDGGWI